MNDLNKMNTFCRNFINRKIEIPIRSSDMGLLIYISQNIQVTPTDAKNYFAVSKPMIASMVKRLLQGEYIYKKSNLNDSRSSFILLTDKGNDLVEKSFYSYTRFMKELKDIMGTIEYNKLMDSLEAANNAIERMK